jgi:cyanophycinase
MTSSAGSLVVLGSSEARTDEIGVWLGATATGRRAVVVPTAAAFEGPEAAVVDAAGWLAVAGFEAEALMALSRSDASDADLAGRAHDAAVAMVVDGSPLHLRTALRDTALFVQLVDLHDRGGVVVAEGAAAGVLCDPMMDPRGGSLTVGLGLVRGVVVVAPSHGDTPAMLEHKLARTVDLAPGTTTIVAVPGDGVLEVAGDGTLRVLRGAVQAFRSGAEVALG